MAKIILNNKEFNIDDAVIASINEELKNHLLITMAGEGATITLGGTTYNVDSTKLSTATNSFITHLGTIAGSGSKVVVNGVEYGVDSTKVSGAISELESVFGGLNSGSDSGGDSVVGTWVFNETPTPLGGDTEAVIDVEGKACRADKIGNGAMLPITYLYFTNGETTLKEITAGDDSNEWCLYYKGWVSEASKTIELFVNPSDTEFITWLKANATKVA